MIPSARPWKTWRLIRRIAVTGLVLTEVAAAQPSQGLDALDLAGQQQLVFKQALTRIAPSVVRIDTIGGAQPVRRDTQDMSRRAAPGFRQADGPTTGVVWSADGYILTSSFNFARDPVVITVTLADGRKLVARLIARDRSARLALLKINAENLPVPARAEAGSLRPGQWTLAAGWGYGGALPCVTVGILSALRRMDGRAVQTDAKISPANYGGPLFDVEGRLIGVCAPLGPGEDELAGVEWYDSGIGFAVRCDFVDRRIERLKRGEILRRGLLGVNLDVRETAVGEASLEEGASGLRILGEPRGPAAEAGLQTGDVVTRIDGMPTPRIVDFKRAVALKAAGDEIKVEYIRSGDGGSAMLRLAAPSDFKQPPAATP